MESPLWAAALEETPAPLRAALLSSPWGRPSWLAKLRTLPAEALEAWWPDLPGALPDWPAEFSGDLVRLHPVAERVAARETARIGPPPPKQHGQTQKKYEHLYQTYTNACTAC